MSMTRKEERAYKQWLELKEKVSKATQSIPVEDSDQKAQRIKKLLNDFEAFCYYYFPHYCTSPFGWFHKVAFKQVIKDKDFFGCFEFPREHAKSVLVNILIPAYLKAKGELTGMMLASQNATKAKVLLGGLQAELEANNLYKNDFGQQVSYGNWEEGSFVTTDGFGFWAFGRGQSPRGTRSGPHRPNYGSIDDIDDKVLVRNEVRVRDTLEWILEDFFGALAIKGSRLILSGNRIHKKSTLAHFVGDVEQGDPKRKGLFHLKVFALENKKREADYEHGKPAWKENYSRKVLLKKMDKLGYRSAQREFFHKHIEQGLVFKREWIEWADPLPFTEYIGIVTYCDPSFKATKTSDYKAVITVGKRKDGKLDVLDAWVKQASIQAMVSYFYDLYRVYGKMSEYWMEANMLQDLLMPHFDSEAERQGFHIPLRRDKAKKANKEARIESLSPLFERAIIRLSSLRRKSVDMQTLKNQLLAFPQGHDDAPDALEGAESKLRRKTSKGGFRARLGKFIKKGRSNGISR